ncbi:hypothetical protein BDY24DRAFT_394379, partial [Mrakia frigida]|uniref:uncharacterized protein n=1 Tax=Mrakia frigida TaxID=29902 RepID=UPI003FCBFE5D
MSSSALSPSFQALASLSEDQLSFLRSLPKAELHAHLNGCIPISVLQQLASERNTEEDEEEMGEIVKEGLAKLEAGVTLDRFQDFFALFPAIYHLTSTPSSIQTVTFAVLSSFLLPTPTSSCTYLELRTTPRSNPKTGLTRRSYLETVLSVVDEWNAREGDGEGKCRLIVSVDVRMGEEDLKECVELAGELKREGRAVVGMDLCGDPSGPTSPHLIRLLARARDVHGLPLTLHLAELPSHRQEECQALLLELKPKRVGHGTFLSDEAREVVKTEGMTVEVCLSSNVLCKTTPTLEESHLLYYLDLSHPVTICTDDTLPFRTSLMAEYALLMADAPLGLAMKEEDVRRIASWGVEGRFPGW